MSKSNFSLRCLAQVRYGDGFTAYVDSLTESQEERDFLYHFALYSYTHHPEYLIKRYLPKDCKNGRSTL